MHQDEKIISLVGGNQHILALSNHNRVLACGSNKWGEIGSNPEINPCFIEISLIDVLYKNETVIKIVAGDGYTFLLTNQGDILGIA